MGFRAFRSGQSSKLLGERCLDGSVDCGRRGLRINRASCRQSLHRQRDGDHLKSLTFGVRWSARVQGGDGSKLPQVRAHHSTDDRTREACVVRGLGVGRPDPAAGEGWSPSDRRGPTPQCGHRPGLSRRPDRRCHHVRAVLNSLDEPVVLVGHSYGGMVITELADHPKVRHSVYLAAFWPQRGQSLLDLIGDGPSPPWIVARDDGALRSPTSSLLENRCARTLTGIASASCSHTP
jgi:pimeloyl-ACP methyl ester carboxylesterase